MGTVGAFILSVLALVGLMRIERWIRPAFTWAAICRFAFKRAHKHPGKTPAGLPGHRDPDSKCRYYFPVTTPSGTGDCQTDGHYLCSECEHISAEAISERSGIEYDFTRGTE